MAKERKANKIFGIWIDLLDTKDKLKKLGKKKFQKELQNNFNKAIIDSIHEAFFLPGANGITMPLFLKDMRVIIFADTIYMEIVNYEFIPMNVLIWLCKVYRKLEDSHRVSIYVSVGELLPYSKEMQKLPDNLEKKFNEYMDFYNTYCRSHKHKFYKPKIFPMFGLSESLEIIFMAESIGKRDNLGEGIFLQKDIEDVYIELSERLQDKPPDILFFHNGKRIEFVKIDVLDINPFRHPAI